MFSDESPTREFLLSNGFTHQEFDLLQTWWRHERQADETIAATMTRIGVFRSSAERTIELMRKGFIQGVNRDAIFQNGGLGRLKSTLSSHPDPVPPRTTPVNGATFSTRHVQTVNLTSMTPLPPSLPVAGRFPQVGDTLGRCLLTGVLGKGGFGTVFSALHTTLNVPVAVKVLCTKDRLPENVRELLKREAQVLARICHNSIVRILDFDDAVQPYFVMEFVEGPSLADLIRQTGSIRFERAIEMVIQVVEGLAEAWRMGIVHRDIKPGNILVTKSGQAKLADLGLAQVPGLDDKALTPDPNKPIGTCAYIAPEQIRNSAKVDFRADIYALGGTLYHAITGQLPFPGKSQREVIMKHLTAEPVLPYSIAPDRISPAASLIILKMLRKDPTERFQSYDELTQALSGLLRFETSLSASDINMTIPEQVSPSKSLFGGWFARNKTS